MKQCSRCRAPMTKGWFCCEEHFCSQVCLDESFIGTGETWDEHYNAATSEDGSGDCYWTQWEEAIGHDCPSCGREVVGSSQTDLGQCSGCAA